MLNLSAQLRTKDEKANNLREENYLPGVVYGYEIDNTSVKVKSSEFKKVQREAGESTLITLAITNEDGEEETTTTVLIQETQEHPITNEFTHVDFYQPNLEETVEVEVPLEFVGESQAVEEEDGTLVRNISEVTIEALPESLVHEIEVDISSLETFEDVVKVEDLSVPEGVEILEDEEAIVASVTRPQELEEELEEPMEEELEDIEVVGEEEEEAEEGEEVEEEEEQAPEEESTEESQQQQK